MGVTNVMSQTLIQTVTPENLLGRVTSVDASVSTLTVPIGSFLGGIMGSLVGVVTTMAVAALSFAFVSLYFAIRPRLRSLPAMDDIDQGDFAISDRSSSEDVD
jgi:hypothetical protein